jgi:hypothetical protein
MRGLVSAVSGVASSRVNAAVATRRRRILGYVDAVGGYVE